MTGPNSVFNQTQFQVAPTRFIARSLGETVIKVSNLDNVLFENVAPVTVTDFASAAPGQIISILGDGQTTIDNNTRIVTNTGADLLLDADVPVPTLIVDVPCKTKANPVAILSVDSISIALVSPRTESPRTFSTASRAP